MTFCWQCCDSLRKLFLAMLSIAEVVMIICLSWSVLCEPPLIYKLKNIECVTIPTYSTNASCFIKAINWNKAVAQMDVDLVRPLHNISVRLQVMKKDYSNQFQPFLIDVTINLCDIFSKRSFMTYGIIIMKIGERFSNLNHSCPYAGHLFARDAYVDQTFLPISPPLGLYKMNITIMENFLRAPAAHVGGIIWYTQIMPPIKKNIRPMPKNPRNLKLQLPSRARTMEYFLLKLVINCIFLKGIDKDNEALKENFWCLLRGHVKIKGFVIKYLKQRLQI